MDIELLFLDDLRSEFERVPPALEIEQLLSGGGEDVNGAELLGRLAQRAARHLIQAGVVRCRAPGSHRSASGTSVSGAFGAGATFGPKMR